MQVDPGVGPVVKPRGVGDRGADRNGQPAKGSQRPQGRAQQRILDHDDVGTGVRDRAPQLAPTERRQRQVGGVAGRCQLEEHPVGQLVAPADLVQVDVKAVRQKPAQPRPHNVEVGAEIDRGHVVAGIQAVYQRASDGDVALADVGAHHQHPDAGRGLTTTHGAPPSRRSHGPG